MTTLHEEQSSSGSHSGLEMSPLLKEEEPSIGGQHTSEIIGNEKPVRNSNTSSNKTDADGTHSDPEFSEFESYQVC